MSLARSCLVVLLLAGCTATPAPAPDPPTPQFPPTPPPDPVAICSQQIEYWTEEKLRDAADSGYDYQHMGLTSGQADALRVIVDRARVEGPGVVPRLAREACEFLAVRPREPWSGTG